MSSMLQRTIGIFLLLLFAGTAKAGIDLPILRILDGTTGQVKKDSVVMVEDVKFFDNSYDAILPKSYAVRNMVSLEINEDALLMLQTNFKVTARLQITQTKYGGVVTVEEKDFTIRYDQQGSYPSRATYLFENAYRVEVKILSLDSNGTTSWNVCSVLKVVNQLQSFPKYNFDCETNAVRNIFHDLSYTPGTTADEVKVWWAPQTGADEYDLEWTFIDADALSDSLYGDPNSPDLNKIFENNASRVTISGTEYKLPLFYDGKGKLFFRVRSVHWQDVMGPELGRVEAKWSSDYTNGTGKLDYNGHEQALNWQSSISFAEDGKRKGVMQYFDGSLRSRQTVTKDNVSNKTIVTESMYDYQGRPVIQTLPVPTLSNVIGYTKNFNRSIGNMDYDKSLFDTLTSTSAYCEQSALPMDVTSGASRYYSPSNDSASSNNPIYKYIPDAEGYPFTEVVYLQDGTGRVSRQSGVGKDFRIGSGHETRFYYGTPTQNELDALFGTEVGDKSHYFKNMVRDANGQLSVSYVDMRGRTIATALAGDTVQVKLDKLPSRNSRYITDVLSDSASSIRHGLVMESKMALPVSKEGLHTFKYELSPQVLKLEGCDTAKLCYDCLYDLTITITDDCNNANFGGVPYVHTVKNFSLNSIDTSCNTATGFTTTLNLALKPGVYQITKKLTLSQYAMDYYRDSVFMKKNHCKSIEDFIREQRQIFQESTQECEPTCSGCIDSLGTWEQFWTRYRTRTGISNEDTANYREAALVAYENALEDCNQLCNARNEYQELRYTMLSDMTPPAGQYASYDTTRAYNIFGRDADAAYRKISGYKDGTGKPDSVFITPGLPLPPQQLTTTAFRDNFKESWAETLLQVHPEYCKLQKLDLIKASYEWDKRFEETHYYAQAKQKGYLNPTGATTSPFSYFAGSGTIENDPLASMINGRFKAALEEILTNFKVSDNKYYSMWGVAAATAVCPTTTASCLEKYRLGPALDTAVAICDADRDMAWRTFRTFYLQAKKVIINNWLNSECSSPSVSSLIDLGYQPRFANADQMLGQGGLSLPNSETDVQNQKTAAEQKLQETYDANCRAYVSHWLAQLSTCKLYSQSDLDGTIIPQLIQVCKEGSDLSHPLGSSSVKPGSTYAFRSFEEVIDNFNRIKGITSPDCNSYGITWPAPYDKQQAYSQKQLISKPDTCECNLITQYYYRYQTKKNNYTSFSDYMDKVTSTKISDTVLNKLLGICDGTYSCNFLAETLVLPTAFQCNTGEVCIDCDMFRKADSTFRFKYPSVYANGDLTTRDSVQKSWNTLYQNYMNAKLGFTKTATEYLDFAFNCEGKWRSPGCDSLNKILADFKDDWKKKHAVSYHITSQEGFTYRNPVDFIRNGATMFPDSIRQKPGTSWNNFGFIANSAKRFCVENGFTTEIRFRFLQDLLVGDVFYILTGGSSIGFERYPNWMLRPDGSYKKGILLSNLTGVPPDTSKYGYDFGNNGFEFETADTNANVILDWCVVKYKITRSMYSVYFNGKLVKQIARDSSLPINSFQAGGLGMRGRHGSVDWWKFYDANDQLIYFEDFNDLQNPASPKPPQYCGNLIPDCEAAFRTFFNTRLGTSYTTAQIEQLYFTKCGRAVDVCNKVDTLKATLARFNENKPTRPVISLQSSGLPAPDSLITDRTRTFRDGALMWPGYIQTRTDSLYTHASIRNPGLEYCTGLGFGAEARMKLISAPLSGNANIFSFTNANVKYVISLAVTGLYLKELWMYNSSNVWVNALSTPVLLNQGTNGKLQEWHDFKITVKTDSIRFSYDGVVKAVLSNLKGSMVNSDEFDYSFLSYNGVLDWIKINDHTGDRVYVEEFNDVINTAEFNSGFICSALPNCQSDFVNYFNQQRGTSLNFQKIDSLYFVYTGRSLNVCGTKDSLQSIVDRYKTASGIYRLRTIQFTNGDYYKTTPYYYHEIPKYAVGEGMFRWPDTLRDSNEGSGWRLFTFMPPQFYFCTEQGYTIEAKVHSLRDIWRTSDDVMYVIDANHQVILHRRDVVGANRGLWIIRVTGYNPATGTTNKELLQPVNNFIKISDDPYELTNKWSTLRIEITSRRYKFYWDDVLKADIARSVNTISPVNTVSFANYSFYAAMDWVRMLDHRGVEQWRDDFEDRQHKAQINPGFICPKPTAACQGPFTNYYNQQKGTNYTYAKIDSLYYAMNGRYLNICGTDSDPKINTRLCGTNKPLFGPFSFIYDDINNCTDSTYFITSKSRELYRIYLDSLKGVFDSSYRAKCLDAYKFEKFTVRREMSEYHYTLYYYDQAGNLVKTVPPAGVNPNYDSLWLVSVKAARAAKTEVLPLHELPTDYRYNTLNQVVAQKSPDGGMSKFWYDRLGRLSISQNAKQRYASATEENRLYSYTKYDILGRITEVGQVKNLASNGAMLDTITRTPTLLEEWLTTLNQRREQITSTVYDLAYEGFVGVLDDRQLIKQRNLRNRVSYTTYSDGWNTANYNQGTFYTYDIHGNVDTLLQDYGCGTCGVTAIHNVMNQNGNRFKKISYNFDLISGKVNSVAYQRGWSDQFYHKYSYDGENRLTVVETSLDGYTWEKDARYEYYLHGPLARTVIGTQQVQGIDYAYTLQGWLKGINSAGAKDSFDIGGDGKIISSNRYLARDAFGFALNYHGTDFKAIGPVAPAFPNYSAHLNNDFRPLYNGNISSMVSTNRIFENPALSPDTSTLFFNYKYDQLNRITGMDVFHNFNRTANDYTGLTKFANGQYGEQVSYDPNGNILKYLRNTVGSSPAMDDLTYHYYPGTNKLKRVNDLVPANKVGSGVNDKIIDIDDQEDEENYIYDSIGNLIRDKAEKINSIDWNVYGKIVGISRDGNTHVSASEIKYSYDASGNRISKSVEKNNVAYYTWYVRDAQGNVMATYNSSESSANNLPDFDLKASERYIYGNSRLGVVNKEQAVDNGNSGPAETLINQVDSFPRGMRMYELNNHLGNVLVTVSDKKKGVSDPSNAALIKFFEPIMLSGTDYYPFGMPMRVGGHNKYKYGFNGKENDNEVKGGDGLQQDYGMRVYDPRLGKFLSVDPLQNKFPWNSPYAYAENDVIRCVDLDGLEKIYHYEINYDKLKPVLKKVETKGPLSTFSYTLSFPRDNLTYSSNVYNEFDVGYGIEFVNKAFYGRMLYSSVFAEQPTTMEGLVDAFYIAAEQRQAILYKHYENSDEAIANQALAASFPLMMDMYSSMGQSIGRSIRASSTSSMGPSNTKVVTPNSSTNAQASRVNNGNNQAASSNNSANKRNYENFGSESLDIPSMRDQKMAGGAARAANFGASWEGASLNDVLNRLAPGATASTKLGKTTYSSESSKFSIIYDNGGKYFRIMDKTAKGKRVYTDLNGNINNNKIVNGKTQGMNQGEYNQSTHYNNTDH